MPAIINFTLPEDLKIRIRRSLGDIDGPHLIRVIESLSCVGDIEFDGFRLKMKIKPVSLRRRMDMDARAIETISINRRLFLIGNLETKLANLRGTATGRTFPVTIENDVIVINTAAISEEHLRDVRNRRLEAMFSGGQRDFYVDAFFNDDLARQERESEDRIGRLLFEAMAQRPRYETRHNNHSADFMGFFEAAAPQASSAPKQSNNAKILSEIRGFNSEDIPEKYCCPLSGEIMDDPVYDPAYPQYKFERAWIQRTLERKQENPYTRTSLSKDNLVGDQDLKKEIRLFMRFARGETFCGLRPGFLI